jgi:tRNA(Ile)-lysidine synthase
MPDPRGVDPAAATDLEARARALVERHQLLTPGDRVLVAVSGGADSVALLHFLTRLAAEYRLALRVCHVHHGLRPEADAEQAFVEDLAAALGCEASVEQARVVLGAGRSPEDAARAARHAALARAARRFAADRVALGHTADDQIETVLMRFIQGAGPRGLAGMAARRGRIVRPLLEVDRTTVEAYLRGWGLRWVEDSSNRDPKFLRNRIRHEIRPVLTAHVGPHLGPAIQRLAHAAGETVDALDRLVAPRLEGTLHPAAIGWSLGLSALGGLPPGAVKAFLRLALVERAATEARLGGLRASHLEALVRLVHSTSGARVRLPGGVIVERGRDALWIVRRAPLPGAVAVAPGPGRVEVPGSHLSLVMETGPPAGSRPADPAGEAWFDADALAAVAPSGLWVRAHRAGDRIVPFGGAGSVRVTRLLAEAGVAPTPRARWPLLVGRGDGDDTVLWVVGVRRGVAAPVTPETTTVVRIRAVVRRPAGALCSLLHS